MSTPGCVKLRHFKAMSLVISQILDFFRSPPSRPVSCSLSLFQSRPWPAAWRRPRRGEPPWGSPAASCRAAAQAGPPAPPALGPAARGQRNKRTLEEDKPRNKISISSSGPRLPPPRGCNAPVPRAAHPARPCRGVPAAALPCLPPGTDTGTGDRSVLQCPPSTRLGRASLWTGAEQWMCRKWSR